jgi:hypothetical protein
MRFAGSHRFRTALAIGLVVTMASLFAVLHAAGSFAGSSPTIAVTCKAVVFSDDAATATFTWSANGAGSMEIYAGGSNTLTLETPGKTGSFSVKAGAFGQTVDASATLYSTPDKTGHVAVLASGSTPAGGCGV